MMMSSMCGYVRAVILRGILACMFVAGKGFTVMHLSLFCPEACLADGAPPKEWSDQQKNHWDRYREQVREMTGQQDVFSLCVLPIAALCCTIKRLARRWISANLEVVERLS